MHMTSGQPYPIPQGAPGKEQAQTYPNLWLGGYSKEEQKAQIDNYLEAIGRYVQPEAGLAEDVYKIVQPTLEYTPKGDPVAGIPASLTFEVQMRAGPMSDLTALISYIIGPALKFKEGYNVAESHSPTSKLIEEAKTAANEHYTTSMQYLAALEQQSNRSVGYTVDLGTLGPFTPAERDKIIDYVLG